MLKSFKFIANNETKLLVIGSMPGVASLKAHEYYAHPRNLFWRFVFEAFNENFDNPSYTQKVNLLLSHHIGLWDSVKNCHRKGSSDALIYDVIPNNFSLLLTLYPNIEKFLFNGKKSFELFKRFNPDLLLKKEYIILPSTSPANASVPYNIKKNLWINQLKSIY